MILSALAMAAQVATANVVIVPHIFIAPHVTTVPHVSPPAPHVVPHVSEPAPHVSPPHVSEPSESGSGGSHPPALDETPRSPASSFWNWWHPHAVRSCSDEDQKNGKCENNR